MVVLISISIKLISIIKHLVFIVKVLVPNQLVLMKPLPVLTLRVLKSSYLNSIN